MEGVAYRFRGHDEDAVTGQVNRSVKRARDAWRVGRVPLEM